ncbi:lecithin-cholesterol acyltransferase-like 1 [Cucurbita pepo subsp. pepo]|uniref:lecithin-cholesterol acyltransferase-like 1 n=1 Tax=Cucurbita pepo subsp. pepo TaxID=3664 RepID=UPI000C9D7450|nr:lecithin-cholesterol acyltransferase-like 1 [Cucurbita pepo subsp. pepo]
MGYHKSSRRTIHKQRKKMKGWLEDLKIIAIVSMAMVQQLYMCESGSSLHPVILIPGAGGNQLEARLTKDYKSSSVFCSRWNPIMKDTQGWFRLWFTPTVLLAPYTDCFARRMTLYYDTDSDDYRNAIGVQTRVNKFGSVQSLLYLDPTLKKITTYMAGLVDSLEAIGYVRDKTLFGAPYDFRYGLAPEGHPCAVGSKFLKDLKELVEKASSSNGGKSVILVSHSLGGLFALQFLNRNPPSWRKHFIKHLVALSTPWGGSVEGMRTFASGNTLGVPLVNPLLVRTEQRSSESNLWLLPNPTIYDRKTPIVITQNSNYTVDEIPRFLKDIGFGEGVYPYESRIVPLMEQLQAPGVHLTCVIGGGVKTPETLSYGENGFDEQPEIGYGDGDGTVNTVSLRALERLWAEEKNQTLETIVLPGVSHKSILEKRDALDAIINKISGINSMGCRHTRVVI